MLSKTSIALLIGSSAASVLPEVLPRGYATAAGTACSQLKAAFPNNYVDQSSSNYQSEVQINWSTNCDLPAACFFTPSDTDMVAKGLAIVVKAGSQFAVRNGGHNPNVNFASVDNNGVLFDMGQMKTLTLNNDNTIMYAGTGNKGGDIQKIADSVGKSGVTGLNVEVGISGLTLGGGYTLFSQLNGLVADNIANFEVVLGNSSIVNANATSNKDLYRALRGGGNNFGIVTRFDMRTSDTHNIWYSIVAYSPSDYEKVMPALAEVQANMEKDPKANVYMLASKSSIIVAFFYAEPADSPAAFAPLLNLKTMAVSVPPTNGTVYKLAVGMSTPEPAIVRMINSVITKPDGAYFTSVYKEILSQAPTSGNQTNLVLAIKPMGSRVPAVGTARASGIPNSLNMPPISQTWTSILVQYQDDNDKDRMSKILDNMTGFMTSEAQKDGLLLDNLFANDAGASQNVLQSYGEESLANLKAVSQRYDADQVFQTLQAGGWFVSKV